MVCVRTLPSFTSLVTIANESYVRIAGFCSQRPNHRTHMSLLHRTPPVPPPQVGYGVIHSDNSIHKVLEQVPLSAALGTDRGVVELEVEAVGGHGRTKHRARRRSCTRPTPEAHVSVTCFHLPL